MKIAIGSDHAGYQLKVVIVEHLLGLGHEIVDKGTNSQESVDYPIYGALVGEAVANKQVDVGVCICGTGIGISIAANKIHGIRAAAIHDVSSARLARQHNDANVICLGARLLGSQVALDSIEAFLVSDFEGGRHQRRIDEISKLEESH